MKIYKGSTLFYEATDVATVEAMVDSLTNDLNQNHYTKAEVMNLIASSRSVVQVATLPANPQRNTIYYVGSTSPYHVYLYDSNGTQVDMGSSEVDLTNYVAKTDITTSISSASTNGEVAGAKAVYDYTTPVDALSDLSYTFYDSNWSVLNNDIHLVKIAPTVYHIRGTFVSASGYAVPIGTEIRIFSELKINNRRPYAGVLSAISVTNTAAVGCTYNGSGTMYVNISNGSGIIRIRFSGILIL